ncbi:cold shock small protein YmcF [Mixta theicola]|uniref:cold shock small protein YmcF n=1 Tax=Mixta theicola TaxID=1458355 RepID=UPI003B8480EB
MLTIKYRCSRCQGHQCRISLFDVSIRNPHGAICIFCKSPMLVSYLTPQAA